MRERAVRFGEAGNLIGVFSQPQEDDKRRYPGILFWNAGVLHRVGPHRLWVEAARRLAQAGYPALRFDLGGLGDSDAAGTAEHADAVARDLKDAMDFFAAKSGVDRFVLVGLCSGADDAWPVALEDSRVAGIASLDPFSYPTPKFRRRKFLTHYPRRLLSFNKWRQLAGRLIRRFRESGPERANDAETFRRLPSHDKAQSQLRQLISRGAKNLFIYSGGHDLYNYDDQFFDALDFEDPDHTVEVVYFPAYDHMYMVLADQQRLLDTICDWVERCHPPSEAESEPDKEVSGYI